MIGSGIVVLGLSYVPRSSSHRREWPEWRQCRARRCCTPRCTSRRRKSHERLGNGRARNVLISIVEWTAQQLGRAYQRVAKEDGMTSMALRMVLSRPGCSEPRRRSGAAEAPPTICLRQRPRRRRRRRDRGLMEHHRHHHHGGVTLFIAMSLDTLGVSPNSRRPSRSSEPSFTRGWSGTRRGAEPCGHPGRRVAAGASTC